MSWASRVPPRSANRCPHRFGVLGYCHRMSFTDTAPHWTHFSAARRRGITSMGLAAPVNAPTARSGGHRQGSPFTRWRGLKAFRFAGRSDVSAAIAPGPQLVLDVTLPGQDLRGPNLNDIALDNSPMLHSVSISPMEMMGEVRPPARLNTTMLTSTRHPRWKRNLQLPHILDSCNALTVRSRGREAAARRLGSPGGSG